jgi:hypothetical protein
VIGLVPLAAKSKKRRNTMQSIVNPLQKAQAEVHRGAHSQDLFEVPKRAELDREQDAQALSIPPAAPEQPTKRI